MTYPAYKDSDQVGSVHYAAICKEIGESIWTRQDQEPVRLPPRLVVSVLMPLARAGP